MVIFQKKNILFVQPVFKEHNVNPNFLNEKSERKKVADVLDAWVASSRSVEKLKAMTRLEKADLDKKRLAYATLLAHGMHKGANNRERERGLRLRNAFE